MHGAYCNARKGELVNEDDRLENLLGAFALAVADRLRSETEDAIGHTGAAAAALITIAQYPDRTVEFLRQTLGLSHPAAVRVVDRLVEQRLVRRRAAGRGPALALAPTATGRRRAREILDLRQEVLADALPELSRTESDTLSAILERALAHLADSPRTTICRLCDARRCGRPDCPVVRKQRELGRTPPDPAPL
jgi:DNA-binding MarR family transcriptional regulator